MSLRALSIATLIAGASVGISYWQHRPLTSESMQALYETAPTSSLLKLPTPGMSGVQIYIPPELPSASVIQQPPASPRMHKFEQFTRLLPQYSMLLDKSVEELKAEGYEVKVYPLESSPVRFRLGPPYKELIAIRKRIDNRVLELGLTVSEGLPVLHLREKTLKEDEPSHLDDVIHFHDYGAKMYLDTSWLDSIHVKQFKREFNDYTLTTKGLSENLFDIAKYRLLVDDVCKPFISSPRLYIHGLGDVLPSEITEKEENIFCGTGHAYWSKHEPPVTLGVFAGKYPQLSLELKANLIKERERYEPLLEELLE